MSSSARLRKTHTDFGGGATINSDIAKNLETQLISIMPTALELLKEKYPDITFEYKRRVYKKELQERLGSPVGGYHELSNPYFKPDAGVIFADGIPIYFGEAKRQGTNVQRILEGLPSQSRGNAIERVFKNFREIEIIMYAQDIFPFAVFIFGCDFVAGSSLLDRLTGATCGFPFNEIYVDKSQHPMPRATLFVQPHGFTEKEMLDKTLEVCDESLRCILKNR